jgi:geranylgeranyl transferase type-2 subunit beta
MHKISRNTCLAVVVILSLIALFAGSACAKTKGNDFDFAKTSAFMREMESRPDFPVSVVLANDYVYSLLAIGDTIDPARKTAIVAYLKNAQQKDGGFISDKANKSASLLFTDLALETLGYLNSINAIDVGKVKTFVASLRNADGGFGFSKDAKGSALATTFYAVRILKTLGSLDLIDRAKTVDYVKGFAKKDGGFGYVKGAGVANAKNTYMATYILNNLGKIDDATRKNAVKFLATTPYLNKKSKDRPELDEQLYAAKALKELKAVDKIDKQLAIAFLKKIYISVNGGFGPLEGYGSTPDSTTTGLRILAEIGKLKAPGQQNPKK